MLDQQCRTFGTKLEGLIYRIRPAAYAFIVNEAGELAVMRTDWGGHFLPGGGIEGEESDVECLKRECAEEMGYTVEVGSCAGEAEEYMISFKNNEPLKIVGRFYHTALGSPNGLKCEDDHELIWLPPGTAAERMHVEFQAWAIRRFL